MRQDALPGAPSQWARRPGPRALATGRTTTEVEFGLRLLDRRTGEEFRLLRDKVTSEGERWREKTLDLSPWPLRWVELCVETREPGASAESATEEFAFWSNPTVTAGEAVALGATEPSDLSAEELEARREHLRALGYVQ